MSGFLLLDYVSQNKFVYCLCVIPNSVLEAYRISDKRTNQYFQCFDYFFTQGRPLVLHV